MRPAVALRVVAAVGGGFAVTSLAVRVLAAMLARWGMPGAEAVVAAAMAGFLIYLVVLLWGLACESMWQLSARLSSGAIVLAVLGQWVL